MTDSRLKLNLCPNSKTIRSACVEIGDRMVKIDADYINALKYHFPTFGEPIVHNAENDNYFIQIFFIIGSAILLKKENSKHVTCNARKYKLGKTTQDFADDLCTSLYKALILYPVEAVYAFFQECKLDDLYMFLNHLSEVDFG